MPANQAQFNILKTVKIVLVEPQHPGNIGAAARAMKVMGLSQLCMVNPHHFPSSEASARSSGATDVLEAATVHTSLEQAIADCSLVVGTSARQRHTEWPLVNVRDAAGQAIQGAQAGQKVALVFGRERSGLTNQELDCCHLHLKIPTNADYASLNLAAAVQVVCYELRTAVNPNLAALETHPPKETVSAQDLEGLYQHWAEVLTASGFLDPNEPKLLMRRLRRLFNRCELERTELNILRGALRSLDPRR